MRHIYAILTARIAISFWLIKINEFVKNNSLTVDIHTTF